MRQLLAKTDGAFHEICSPNPLVFRGARQPVAGDALENRVTTVKSDHQFFEAPV